VAPFRLFRLSCGGFESCLTNREAIGEELTKSATQSPREYQTNKKGPLWPLFVSFALYADVQLDPSIEEIASVDSTGVRTHDLVMVWPPARPAIFSSISAAPSCPGLPPSAGRRGEEPATG